MLFCKKCFSEWKFVCIPVHYDLKVKLKKCENLELFSTISGTFAFLISLTQYTQSDQISTTQ